MPPEAVGIGMGERRPTLNTDEVSRQARMIILGHQLGMIAGLAAPLSSQLCCLLYLHYKTLPIYLHDLNFLLLPALGQHSV